MTARCRVLYPVSVNYLTSADMKRRQSKSTVSSLARMDRQRDFRVIPAKRFPTEHLYTTTFVPRLLGLDFSSRLEQRMTLSSYPTEIARSIDFGAELVYPYTCSKCPLNCVSTFSVGYWDFLRRHRDAGYNSLLVIHEPGHHCLSHHGASAGNLHDYTKD